jgi:glyoxylase-like metal-dependent hydrolase (beta-lactamase superfamily II)
MSVTRRRFLYLSSAALALVPRRGALFAQAQTQAPPKTSFEAIRRGVGIFNGSGGTIGWLSNKDALIVVDSQFPNTAKICLDGLKQKAGRNVDILFNTHHHADHSGSNAKMQALGAQVVASAQARQHMVDGNQPGLPSVTYDGRASLFLGGKRVELYHFGRAHTSGDTVVLFPAQRVLAAGDLFTVGNDTPQLVDYPGGGSAKDWPATVDRVLQLEFDNVVPGHGMVVDKAAMRTFRATAERLKNRVHEMIVKKASRDDITKMLKAEFSYADFHINASLDGLLVELR